MRPYQTLSLLLHYSLLFFFSWPEFILPFLFVSLKGSPSTSSLWMVSREKISSVGLQQKWAVPHPTVREIKKERQNAPLLFVPHNTLRYFKTIMPTQPSHLKLLLLLYLTYKDNHMQICKCFLSSQKMLCLLSTFSHYLTPPTTLTA